VEIQALRIQTPSDLTPLINKLLRYSLLQAYDDTVFTRTYYQVHPLNRNHIKETWWKQGEKESAHSAAADYYMKTMEQGVTVETLLLAAHHLNMAQRHNDMAGLITENSTPLRIRGFWDESIYLHNLILEVNEKVERKFLGTAYNNIGCIYENKGNWAWRWSIVVSFRQASNSTAWPKKNFKAHRTPCPM
jgi:hypothetical protein